MNAGLKKGERIESAAGVKLTQLASIILAVVTFLINKYWPGQFDSGAMGVIADIIYTAVVAFNSWAIPATSRKIGFGNEEL